MRSLRKLLRGLFIGQLKSWTRMTSFIAKEVIEVIRRPGVLFSLILGPFLIMGLFGLGYSGQYRPLETEMVIPSTSDLRRDVEFYQSLMGSAVHIVGITDNPDQARDQLQRQQLDLVVVAPTDLQQQFEAGKQSSIAVEYNQLDPVRANYANFVAERGVQNLNQQIIERAVAQGQQYAVQRLGQNPLAIPPEVVAAPTRGDTQNLAPILPTVVAYFAPAVLALVLQHMAVSLTALSMVRERLGGAIDIFRVAPLRTLEVVIGKYLAYGFFNLVVAAVTAVFLTVGLKVPLLGNIAQVAETVLLLTFASLGLGLLISTTVDSERQAVQVSMLVLLASFFFSGFVLPLDQFTPWLRYIAYLLPVTHGIQLLQDFMLRGFTNQPWEMWALAGIGAVLFLLTSLTMKRALASS